MPSNSYLALLVLALAASTVSPVRCAETQQIEDQGHTSSAPASRSQQHARRGKTGVYLGLALVGVLLTVGLVNTFYPYDGGSTKRPPPSNNHVNSTQPTSPPQPNNPPRAIFGREERDLGPGIAVDISSEPNPNSHLGSIADGVFTTAGPSEAGSISNWDGHTSSSFDLLSRAELAKEIILFSRMLDKLD